MENGKNFSQAQFLTLCALFSGMLKANNLPPLNEEMDADEILSNFDAMVWSESNKQSAAEVLAIRFPLLSEIHNQANKINNLDGAVYGNPSGYKAKAINLPSCLRDQLTKEILQESDSDINPDDIEFKRYNGLEIRYVSSPRSMNGTSISGFTYPIQVGMGVRRDITENQTEVEEQYEGERHE